MSLRAKAFLAATAAAVAASGCGSGPTIPSGGDSTVATRTTTTTATGQTSMIVCDMAVAYTSLSQLRRAAAAVVVFKPTGATSVGTIGTMPYTISTVRVLQRVSGPALPATFGLRQTGKAPVVIEGCDPLVSRGHVYLAYVTGFRLGRTGPTVRGQYVVVGGAQGIFERVHDTTFARLDPGAGSLPARITIAQAASSH